MGVCNTTAKYVKDNYEELIKKYGNIVEIPLRNVEVTIRDGVRQANTENFKARGNIFAEYINKAILIEHGHNKTAVIIIWSLKNL